MKHLFLCLAILLMLPASLKANNPQTSAIDSLAMRVTNGTSAGRIQFKQQPNPVADSPDWFSIEAVDNKVEICGNNTISMAVGLNWYLKYVAGIHLSWNNPSQALPANLPLPQEKIEHQTKLKERYYLNYCTFSYSMAFWDEERWMREIDWMALHGVNMPLAMTGIETVWRNVLQRLGYSQKEIGEFVCGPAYMAWWQMNNLEGWGGPLPESWYDQRAKLQNNLLARMRSLGIEPVFPGYVGMVPRNIGQKLGYDIADPGTWCGFPRPAFLSPADPHFSSMADIYYEELTRLYGKSTLYSMDPFHEGGKTEGINLAEAGTAIMDAMKRANPNSRWVIQGWQNNPRPQLTDTLTQGDLLALDLYSEKRPKWNKNNGYGKHSWLYCMLLNFGGNVGMHGRMSQLINGFYDACAQSPTLVGVGATAEGIENNPAMFELLFELPWRSERFTDSQWLAEYLPARYGKKNVEPQIADAWSKIRSTVYNCPVDFPGQGTVESLFCGRPQWDMKSSSSWGCGKLFYDADSTRLASAQMNSVAAHYPGNMNFAYDRADIERQANADKANVLLAKMADAFGRNETESVRTMSKEFLALLLHQDSILESQPLLNVDTWLSAAASLAETPEDCEQYVRNAAQLITVWGNERAANKGGLHDYSHREWAGLLRELYYDRWNAFFNWQLNGGEEPDYYSMEAAWVEKKAKEYRAKK